MDIKESTNKAIDAISDIGDDLELTDAQKTEATAAKQIKATTTLGIGKLVAIIAVIGIAAAVAVAFINKDKEADVVEGDSKEVNIKVEGDSTSTEGDAESSNSINIDNLTL